MDGPVEIGHVMTLSRMPAQIIAGDSLRLVIAAGNYPASAGWSVALVIQALAGSSPVTVNASDGSAEWSIAFSSAASALLTPGAYRYLIAATKNGERSTIAVGQVEVLPNPTVAATDQRSSARRALDAINAVLEGRASSEDLKYTFADGRALEKVPHGDLLALRRHYARIVARETSKGLGPRRVMMRL